MRKLYLVIGLLGLFIACTPPLERAYNKETVVNDMKEIKNLLEPSEFALLDNEINKHIENGGKFKNKIYLQILDSIKVEIQKEREVQLERQRLVFEQPLQLLNATDFGFEEFSFKLFGHETETVGFRLKGSLINNSDKTYVNVEFVDNDNSFWANAKRNPYIEICLNDTFRLACVDFGLSFGNWAKIKDIDLPKTSYETPWRPNEIKSIQMYFQPDVTCGYYIGVNDYGKCLQPVHFNYDPNSCLLKIPIYLEDAKGYRKQMFLSFDIMNNFRSFARTIHKEKNDGIINLATPNKQTDVSNNAVTNNIETNCYYITKSLMAYFFNSPDYNSKRKAYLYKGDKIYITSSQGNFLYGSFSNPKGVTSSGWLLKNDLEKLSTLQN